jgi:KAP family P-loop domain
LLGLWLRGKLVALPANPAKLVAALARRASLGDFSDKLAFRHRFGEQFEQVCQALLTRTSPGLVLLIDDLDRCQPEDVLKVLEAVNYLVCAGPCTVVLGMDRRQVEYCVGLGFEKLVEGLPEDELLYAGEETSDKAGKQRAFARHYLEKLINIEVPVPALDDRATDALLLRGIVDAPPEPEDGPVWLQTTKGVCTAIYQIARVGLLAFVIGIILTWGFERFREPASITSGPPILGTVQEGSVKGETQPGPISTPRERQQQDVGFEPAKVDLQVAQPTHEVPDARRWLWWAPTILLIGLALLFGIAAVARRERRIVRDSPAFASALRCVKPLLAAVNATPRAIKRYQNRMRYLAARLRPAAHDPDGIDSILYRVGRWIGHPLVPDIWFEERPPQAIREPALILLGAIELFVPKAFEKPAELLSALEHGIPGDGRPKERVEVWDSVRKSFAAAHLDLPTAPEIVRYAAFVLVRERVTQSQPADIVRFSRDLGPESQPA